MKFGPRSCTRTCGVASALNQPKSGAQLERETRRSAS